MGVAASSYPFGAGEALETLVNDSEVRPVRGGQLPASSHDVIPAATHVQHTQCILF